MNKFILATWKKGFIGIYFVLFVSETNTQVISPISLVNVVVLGHA